MKVYGGIEAGGTKFVCVIGTGPDNIIAEERFATDGPEPTIGRAIAFFQQYRHEHEISTIGIASFGPLDLDPASTTYGYITTTPKPGWTQTDICGRFQRACQIPVAFDTDVNAAALGEHYWVAQNRTLDTLLYITVGTGIGMGGVINGHPMHGLLHPEAGHVFIPHDREEDPFPGSCPYHGDCLEGLAAGPALELRWGMRGELLPVDHRAWELEARYLGMAVCNLILTLSPQRIILGGGVMEQASLYLLVRCEVQRLLHGYLKTDEITHNIEHYIVAPALKNRSGVLGALALAAVAESRAVTA